jgi:hypothetical protein
MVLEGLTGEQSVLDFCKGRALLSASVVAGARTSLRLVACGRLDARLRLDGVRPGRGGGTVMSDETPGNDGW